MIFRMLLRLKDLMLHLCCFNLLLISISSIIQSSTWKCTSRRKRVMLMLCLKLQYYWLNSTMNRKNMLKVYPSLEDYSKSTQMIHFCCIIKQNICIHCWPFMKLFLSQIVSFNTTNMKCGSLLPKYI